MIHVSSEPSLAVFVTPEFDCRFGEDLDDIQPVANEESSYAVLLVKISDGMTENTQTMLSDMSNGLDCFDRMCRRRTDRRQLGWGSFDGIDKIDL